MRVSTNCSWGKESVKREEQVRKEARGELIEYNSQLSYCNHKSNKKGVFSLNTRGGLKVVSSVNKSNNETFLDNYNVKSPNNNYKIAWWKRALAAVTVFSVVASGPTAILGQEPISEEEKNEQPDGFEYQIPSDEAYVYNPTTDDYQASFIGKDGNNITYIRPMPTPKVKEKGAN